MADHPTMKPGEKFIVIFGYILIICLVLLVLYVLSIALDGVGGFAEVVFRRINRLFYDATHAFRTARGFGAFIQLILIAGVLSWAIKRIMNYIGRR